MSDQDFFFDEEDEAPKPASSSAASKGASQGGAKAASAKPAPRQAAAPAPAPASFMDQNVTVMVAGMLMVIGVLVGFIIGYLVGGGTSSAPAATSTVPEVTSPSSGTPGNLTQDQIDQGLPAGHPNISGMSSGTTTPTP